jgi:RIO-like serine/threonine protein kinase
MRATSIYVDNREVPLGRQIGKGGEGEVYLAASEAGVAVKIHGRRQSQP